MCLFPWTLDAAQVCCAFSTGACASTESSAAFGWRWKRWPSSPSRDRPRWGTTASKVCGWLLVASSPSFFVRTYIYIYIHMCIYIHTHICIYIYIYTHILKHMFKKYYFFQPPKECWRYRRHGAIPFALCLFRRKKRIMPQITHSE